MEKKPRPNKKKKTTIPTETLFRLSIISQQQVDSLQIAFDLMDDDKSGSISAKELQAVVNRFKEVDQEELEDLVAESEEFQDGQVDFEEFVEFMLSKITKKEHCLKYLQEIYEYFDTESKGLLGPAQFKGLMNDHEADATNEEIMQMVEDANFTEEEDYINFEDFVRPLKFPGDQ